MNWRRLAFGLLWVAILFQLRWTIVNSSRPFDRLALSLVFTGGMLPFALTWGRFRLGALLARLVVGGAFLKALVERVGDYGGFVRYAARVNSFLPSEVIPTIAAAATVCECVLCLGMLFGIRTRWVAGGSAVLLCLFATAMTISGLSQASWAVWVLSAGAFALATTDGALLSIDNLMAANKGLRTAKPAAHDPAQ